MVATHGKAIQSYEESIQSPHYLIIQHGWSQRTSLSTPTTC
jgi:hypothetical protein